MPVGCAHLQWFASAIATVAADVLPQMMRSQGLHLSERLTQADALR